MQIKLREKHTTVEIASDRERESSIIEKTNEAVDTTTRYT